MLVTPKEQLECAAKAIGTAALLLRTELPTMEAFLKEARDMESFGHIADPTLYRNSERRAVNAVMEPMFKAAVTFVRAYDEHTKRATEALAKVTAE